MTKAKLPASSVEVGAESTRLGRFACHTTFDQLPIGIPRSSVLLWTIQTLLAFSCTTIRLRFFFIETCQIMDSLSLVTLPKRFPNHRFASGLSPLLPKVCPCVRLPHWLWLSPCHPSCLHCHLPCLFAACLPSLSPFYGGQVLWGTFRNFPDFDFNLESQFLKGTLLRDFSIPITCLGPTEV